MGGSQRQVIIFFSDLQCWDTTGVHNNLLGLTPNFDRVAQSVRTFIIRSLANLFVGLIHTNCEILSMMIHIRMLGRI